MSDNPFGRRAGDADLPGLLERMGRVEKDVTDLKSALETANGAIEANTALTEDMHVKNGEMYAAFTTAKNGVRMIAGAGNAVMRVSDAIERRPKTTALAIVTGVVSYSLAKTGQLPDWFTAVLKALIA